MGLSDEKNTTRPQGQATPGMVSKDTPNPSDSIIDRLPPDTLPRKQRDRIGSGNASTKKHTKNNTNTTPNQK